MAVYTVNRVVKTLTIHKENCRKIPREHLKPCCCGDTGQKDNQRWFCEEHISLDAVNEYMNGKFWAILMCDICFREGY
ncbi:MAG: hypothetical protein ABFD51_09035 [Anaerolineaceae bacterium]